MKTITIDKVKYELEVHDFNKKLSEIKIPKGWRLLYPSEAILLYERGILTDFWIFVMQTNKEEKNKGNVAGFCANSVGAGLYCDGDPSYTDSALGVLFAKDLK